MSILGRFEERSRAPASLELPPYLVNNLRQLDQRNVQRIQALPVILSLDLREAQAPKI
jgi:hypothetical protein